MSGIEGGRKVDGSDLAVDIVDAVVVVVLDVVDDDNPTADGLDVVLVKEVTAGLDVELDNELDELIISDFPSTYSMKSGRLVDMSPTFPVISGDPSIEAPSFPGGLADGWTQWYCTSRYLDVPGQGSPKIFDDTTTEQFDDCEHLSCMMRKDLKDMQLTERSSCPVGLQMEREKRP